jgi:hypothetical protein
MKGTPPREPPVGVTTRRKIKDNKERVERQPEKESFNR